MDRFMRFPEIIKITGAGRSTIYKWMDEGRFPKSVKIGGRAVGWLESDIEKWINDAVKEALS